MIKTRHFAQSSCWFTNWLTYFILLINRDIAVYKSLKEIKRLANCEIDYTLKQIVVFDEKQYYQKDYLSCYL